MKTVVGVMGPGSSATKQQKHDAYEIGRLVGKTGSVLLSGGMDGTMESSCMGARAAGGFVVAISPAEHPEGLNDFVDIAILTGMGSGRNYINILSSEIVIAIGSASPGTLSEIAHAIQMGRPLIIFSATEEMKTYLTQMNFDDTNVHFVDSLEETEKLLKYYLDFLHGH